MLTNISISHLVQVGHLQCLNISPSSGRAPPGALRLSYPPRVDFLLPSLTIWPPEQDPEYEMHTLVVRRAKSVLIHLSPDETFDVALAGWCLSCATGAPPSPRVWLPLPHQLLRDQSVLLPVCVRETPNYQEGSSPGWGGGGGGGETR